MADRRFGMLSGKFRAAIKLSPHRQYEFAAFANVDPSTLSAWLSGAKRVRPGDPRIELIGAALGLTADECFEPAADRSVLTARLSLAEEVRHG